MSDQVFEQAEKMLADIKAWKIESAEDREKFRIAFLGSKNKIKPLFGQIKDVEPSRKKEFGQTINAVKQAAQTKFDEAANGFGGGSFSGGGAKGKIDSPDLTRPVAKNALGSMHPVSIVMNEIIDIFKRIGFVISEGPEIEDDWHNFTALNFPPDHPARDMQDTFFITEDLSLRTHTSSVQVRVMEDNKPPLRTISPGRVFRNETISARAHCQFHQVEGLYVDTDVSFADLKQTLYFFAKEMFGQDTKIRFRPSYFPFTEISAEMDISCFICKQEGCAVCKKTGWVEIGGCGMVDPNVLENCKIDSEKYTGFAFGLGVERISMLKYRINDIRLLFENDIRFLRQFTSSL